MSVINLPLSNCEKCPLYRPHRYNPHNYMGNLDNPKVCFIGEAPGQQEAATGKVFQGKAGKLLRRELDKVGITDYCMFNVVACRPSKNKNGKTIDRKPNTTEIKHCRENLDAFLEHVKPDLIVPLGATALHRLKVTGGITGARGLLFENEYGKIIPTFHPAYILRSPGNLVDLQADLKVIKRVSEGGELSTKKLKVEELIAESLEDVELIEQTLLEADYFAFDLETDSVDSLNANIMGIGFSDSEGRGYYIPLLTSVDKKWHWEDEKTQLAVINSIERIMLSGARKVAHNGKFDTKCLKAAFDIDTENFWLDSMLLHYLLDENNPHGLKIVGPKYFSEYRNYQMELKNALKASDFEEESYGDVPLEILGPYCIKDNVLTYRLARALYNEASENILKLLFYLYMPLSHIYAQAELTGIRIDKPYVKDLIEKYEKLEAEELQKVYEIAGREFNLNSWQQLGKVLYNPPTQPADWEPKITKKGKREIVEEYWPGMGFPVTEDMKTDSGAPGTAEGILKELPQNHPGWPIIEHILKYRGYNKMLTTYLRPFYNKADENDRVHTSFLLHGTVTGRLSSKPNVQNIPRDPEVKGMFIAAPGFKLVEIDYSQAELRVMAYYSKDPVMTEQYVKGEDIHMTTACSVFKLPPDQITKRQRKLAKLTNFGGMYGGSPKKLMNSINEKLEEGEKKITLRDAEKLRKGFFDKYKGIARYIDQVHHTIHTKKQVESVFGRIRRLPQVDSPHAEKVAEAEREGLNALIQGTASDLTQLALIKITNYIAENNLKSRFLLSVHDALIFEVAEDELDHIEKFKAIMEKSPTGFDFPLIADAELFPARWGSDSEVLYAE